jgi:hypothetical protein
MRPENCTVPVSPSGTPARRACAVRRVLPNPPSCLAGAGRALRRAGPFLAGGAIDGYLTATNALVDSTDVGVARLITHGRR